ncbi:1,4-dihydroxy-6-naphthoate synthase [Desulfomicrobium macestii]|uniref:1,4-dihydroxy-6-naphtoate synthase n=2 Tax=Desulfomicrobium TaxID=898 RepID=A0A8G2C0T7_DESNO|nr:MULTISPECIES: 1,4-dihydroxy-6-naphthoate synthase [Desulfomicrobium]MBE1424028.1 1,4-dihydroxy-6-naphthoate synthase [Desulfomicrobium macestii]SFL41704.1 1,4-dihydroxy-6-naphthoate synthase [Desulfomicrobium norvegicum]
MTPLSVAISPCPNDSFIFGAWVLGLTASPAGRDCRFFWHDVQELNQGAFAGAWDVIKVSAATALNLGDTYTILPCGGAFGLEHGPKLVTRKDFSGTPHRIAVPGLDTTAACVLRAALGGNFVPVPMIFHAIVDAVRAGDVDAGLLIHETALVHDRYDLALRLDLGQWWREHTNALPFPLGCIVARNELGTDLHARIADSIRASILHARARQDSVMPFISSLARELDAITLEQHIAAYVNEYSLDMGPDGQAALNTLQTLRDLS